MAGPNEIMAVILMAAKLKGLLLWNLMSIPGQKNNIVVAK
jgi:hypothetical protein